MAVSLGTGTSGSQGSEAMEGVVKTPWWALGFGPGSLHLWLIETLGVGLTSGLSSQHWSCCPVISDSRFQTLQPKGKQMAQPQPLGLAEIHPVAVVQSVPGAHPVPMYAYSIKDSSCRKVSSPQAPPSLLRAQIPPRGKR